jgi:IS1 family transposase
LSRAELCNRTPIAAIWSQPTRQTLYLTQQLECKYLTLRTRIKRLVRKTICFSMTIEMHDTVIGLFINRYEFGRTV